MRHPLLLLLPLTTMLVACSVGPSFEPPAAQLPERWHDESAIAKEPSATTTLDEQALTAQWWKQFADPRLNELIERARTNNLDLRLAALRVAGSRVQRSIATGERWPSVAVNGAYRRERQSEFGVNTRLIVTDKSEATTP